MEKKSDGEATSRVACADTLSVPLNGFHISPSLSGSESSSQPSRASQTETGDDPASMPQHTEERIGRYRSASALEHLQPLPFAGNVPLRRAATTQALRGSSGRSSANASPPPLCPGQRLAFLYASPLVNQVRGGPIDLLDLKAERETLMGAIRKSGVRVDISCEIATTRNLSNLLLDGCRMLHYSGHGFTTPGPLGMHSVLAFEDELGGTHALEVGALQQLVATGARRRDGQESQLELVFVSACHSVEGGEAFVKAGVPHVIAVRREARVQDRAACVFAESFYYALLRSRTVQEAFDVAVQSVANGTGIVAATDEARKFLLLPEQLPGMPPLHDHALFVDAERGPPLDLSRAVSAHNLPAFFPLQFLGRHALWQQAVAGVRQKRAVLLLGPAGVGKTALAVASAHYLLERHAFSGGVYMVSLNGIDSIAALFRAICLALDEATDGLAEADRGAPPPSDIDSFIALLTPLLRERELDGGMCLLLDHCDGLGLPASTLAALVGRLLMRVESLSVMLTSSEPITLSGVAQRQLTVPPLAPLDSARLFVMLAPRSLTHAEIGSDSLDRLAHEMGKLVNALRPTLPEIDQFAMQTPADGAAFTASPTLRVVRWKFADPHSAEIFASHVQQAADALAATEEPPPLAPAAGAPGLPLSGVAQPQAHASSLSIEVRGSSVIGRLSHLRLLAKHRVLRALGGSPRAISLGVHGLVSDDGIARPLDELGSLLEMAGIAVPLGTPCATPAAGAPQSALLGGVPPCSLDDPALLTIPAALRSRSSSGGSGQPLWPGLLSERTQLMLEGIRAALSLQPLDEVLLPSPTVSRSSLGTPPSASQSALPPLAGSGGLLGLALAQPAGRSVGDGDGSGGLDVPPSRPQHRAQHAELDELPPALEIDASEVELEEWLGGGTFGAVYRGSYQGRCVAVKQFFARHSSQKAFAREATLLSQLHHPNVVQLLHVCRRGGKGLLILSEFLETSLFSFLHEMPLSLAHVPPQKRRTRRSNGVEVALLPQSEVLRLTRDIASGMHYLHSFSAAAVLHRNLKSQNLLLDASGSVKVADFGWSRFKDASSGSGSSSTFFHGWQWVAPEILYSKPYTEMADVYSFAMIMWEILTRRIPFKGMNVIQIGLAVREQKLRPNIPSSCPPAHARLIERCWHDEAESRPSFVEILAILSEMQAVEDQSDCAASAATLQG